MATRGRASAVKQKSKTKCEWVDRADFTTHHAEIDCEGGSHTSMLDTCFSSYQIVHPPSFFNLVLLQGSLPLLGQP